MGTPKSSILIACSILNYPFRGPPFMEPPICDWAMTLQDQTSWKQSFGPVPLVPQISHWAQYLEWPKLPVTNIIHYHGYYCCYCWFYSYYCYDSIYIYIYMLHEYNKFKMFEDSWVDPAECASKFLDDGFEPGCHATSPLRSMAENSCDHDPSRSGIHLTHGRQGTVGWLAASQKS